MQTKIKIVNMQFGTEPSALGTSQEESLPQNAFPPSTKIKQYIMSVLQSLNQTEQKRVESVKNLINEESLPILNLLFDFLFTHYTTIVQQSPEINLQKYQKERPQSEDQMVKWYKQLSLKNYQILEKQKKQKQEIQKMQRKLSESMAYIQYMKDKNQRNEKQLKNKNEQLVKLKKEYSSIIQKIKKKNMIKQLCSHSNALLANFHLNSLVYKNPKEVIFDLDYNSKMTENQSDSNSQNLFYRTCYETYGKDSINIKGSNNSYKKKLINDKVLDKNENIGNLKINYPKTSEKNQRKKQLRSSVEKWRTNKISSTLNISDKQKQKQNMRQKQNKWVQDGSGLMEVIHIDGNKRGNALKSIINM